MRLYGLGGFAGSGKDAFADLITARRGFYKTYMSKPLEEALLRVNPWLPLTIPEFIARFDTRHLGLRLVRARVWIRYRDLHAGVGYVESKREPEVRELLQRLGTEVGRDMFGENVWVDAMLRDILSQDDDTLVTGIRFRNEIEAIRSNGGVAVWVERGLAPVNAHVSDNSLAPDDFDVVIDNTGTLGDLAAAADEFYRLVLCEPNRTVARLPSRYLRFNANATTALRLA